MRRTAILKNNNTAEKRRKEEAFALESIAHYCFVEIKSNCDTKGLSLFYSSDPLVNFQKCKKYDIYLLNLNSLMI